MPRGTTHTYTYYPHNCLEVLPTLDGQEERNPLGKRARVLDLPRGPQPYPLSFKLPAFLNSTNTDPFAAWLVVTGDATPDGTSVLGAFSTLPTVAFREQLSCVAQRSRVSRVAESVPLAQRATQDSCSSPGSASTCATLRGYLTYKKTHPPRTLP